MKKLLLSLSALLLLAALVFTGIYFTRFQSMATLQKITDYSDGYNLYRMDIRYRYSLNDLLARGITDDQSMVDAILEEALPLLPVTIQAPSFGCTAFAVVEQDGTACMGRNYDFRYDTSAMVVYCSPQDSYRSVAFAALDNIQANTPEQSLKTRLATLTAPFICLDGMNEKGVSIAVLTLDSEPTYQQTGKPTITPTLFVHDIFNGKLCLYRVSRLIQRRCESCDTHNSGHHSQYSATYTCFSGNTGGVKPIACVLVETYSSYQRSYFRSKFFIEYLFLGVRIEAVIGDCSCAD